MTTCPQCGRVADDEFVCAECGAFLAAERDEEPAGDVPVRRVALLAILVCLLGVGAAAVLLRSNDDKGAGAIEPGVSFSLSSVPISVPGFSSSSTPGGPSSTVAGSVSVPSTTSASTTASSSSSSSSSRSTSPTSSTSISTSTAPQSSASRTPSTSASSTQSTSPRPTTSTPPSSPPPAPPTVQLSRGAGCGPHCYSLAVSIHNFSSGPHTVTCWSDRSGQFDSYSTSATTSTGCPYSHPHDTVWVVVEGHRSNTVTL